MTGCPRAAGRRSHYRYGTVTSEHNLNSSIGCIISCPMPAVQCRHAPSYYFAHSYISSPGRNFLRSAQLPARSHPGMGSNFGSRPSCGGSRWHWGKLERQCVMLPQCLPLSYSRPGAHIGNPGALTGGREVALPQCLPSKLNLPWGGSRRAGSSDATGPVPQIDGHGWWRFVS